MSGLQDIYNVGLLMVNIVLFDSARNEGKRLAKARLSPCFSASSNKFCIPHQ